MEKQETVVEEKWGLGAGPIVLTGRPASCQGYVELINRSAEDVEPRAVAITGLDLGSRQRHPPAVARVSARLGPHARVRAPIEVTLDPTTPPGSYTGQLYSGSQREELVIHVLENWDLRIVPQSVTVTARPGDKLALRIAITNLGNIEFTLPNSVPLHLDHKLELIQCLNTALRAAGRQGFEKVLDRFAQELAEGVVGPATVKFKLEDPRIRAGETKQVELEIQLPDEMKSDRGYAGKMRFKNTSLRIEVECKEAPQSSPRRQK
jgi:hypothetical protein